MATRRVGRAAPLVVLVVLALFAGSSMSEEAAGEPPLTVRYEYQLGENVDQAQREALEGALGVVAAYLERHFRVKRPSASPALFLEPQCTRFIKWSGTVNREECLQYDLESSGKCGSAEVNPALYRPHEVCENSRPDDCRTEGEGNSGALGAQLVVYVTASQDNDCTESGNSVGELASAVFCTQSSTDGRVTSGTINICPQSLERVANSKKETLNFADTMLHEHFHLLGFNPGLFSYFVGEDGSALPEGSVVRRVGSAFSLVSPKVVAAARKHFGCDTLDAVPLEQTGGVGTAGGHWPSFLFGDRELMVPTIAQTRAVVSDITLAVIEDSGWYAVDRPEEAALGSFDFGRNMTCSIFETCDAGPSPYYCDAMEESRISVCASDFYSVGSCGRATVVDKCPTVLSYHNMICRDPSTGADDLGYDPKQWGQAYGQNSRCLPLALKPAAWESDVDEMSWMTIDIGGSGGCFKVRCTDDDQIEVSLNGGDYYVACPEGEFLEASSIDSRLRQGRIGPCPPAASFCRSLGCPGDCGLKGDCVEGACRCFLGFAGDQCEEEVSSAVAVSKAADAPKAPQKEKEEEEQEPPPPTQCSGEGTDCCDVPPPGGDHTCEEEREFGKCDEDWMQGYCDLTCNRCGSQSIKMGVREGETENNQSTSETETLGEAGEPKVPWMVVALGAISLVGVLVLSLTAWLIARRFRRPGRSGYQRSAGESGGDSQRSLSRVATTQEPKLEPGLKESHDLDGGTVGVKAHKLLYGSDIKV